MAHLIWKLIMAKVSVSAIVREVLTKDPTLSADEVVKRVKARGITSPPKSVKHVVHNLRKEFRKPNSVTVPAPAPEVSAMPVIPITASVAPPAQATVASSGLTEVFANVALVNRVLGLCGGPENARQVVEAARSCGGIDLFLQHLDLVAGIRQVETIAK